MWYMYHAALHHQSKISETLFGKHKYNIGGRRLTSPNIPYTHHPQLRLPQSNLQAEALHDRNIWSSSPHNLRFTHKPENQPAGCTTCAETVREKSTEGKWCFHHQVASLSHRRDLGPQACRQRKCHCQKAP